MRTNERLSRLDGEAVTALFTTGGEHFATVLGAHALEETVHAFAAAVMRLEGALHEKDSKRNIEETKARYCTGSRLAQSRNPGRLRIVPILSTPVEKPVDRARCRRPSNPCTTGIPAVRSPLGEVA